MTPAVEANCQLTAMRIGLYVEAEDGVTWPDWRRLARQAERQGFDGPACSGPLQSLQAARRWALDTWSVIAALTTWRRRLAFGPLVVPVTSAPPSQSARLAASLHRLSQGRFRVSLGAGRHAGEHQAFGLPYSDHDRRLAMLGAAVQVIRLLWSGQSATFSGPWYRLTDAELRPMPERPRRGVASSSPLGMRIAATWADEWCAAGPSPEALRRQNAQLDELVAGAGRSPRALARTVMDGILVGRHRAELERRAARLVDLTPSLRGQEPSALVQIAARQWYCRAGRPAEVVDQVQAVAQAGANQAYFQLLDFRDPDAIDLVASEVAPAIER